MKISAVLIVKDEEEIVATALESVKDADEIVVVDTGSTDRTVEIARRYTSNIYYFPWIDDFSAARNYGIEQATGDWIYSIDADHVLLSPMQKVREEAERAEKEGHLTAQVKSWAEKFPDTMHYREVLFKNDPRVRWHGAVHECILPASTFKSDVDRLYGYSKNHYKDPDRNLRILEKTEKKTPRTLFYLGRENYEKRRYDTAIRWMEEYLKEGKWTPEVAEAHLVIARCHWFMQRGDQARAACLQAIRQNPDFKEALLFMGNMHHEPWKSKWHRLASVATNDGVLFVRT
jgi:glycosyltransferase involved in cell wall biosynthesis